MLDPIEGFRLIDRDKTAGDARPRGEGDWSLVSVSAENIVRPGTLHVCAKLTISGSAMPMRLTSTDATNL